MSVSPDNTVVFFSTYYPSGGSILYYIWRWKIADTSNFDWLKTGTDYFPTAILANDVNTAFGMVIQDNPSNVVHGENIQVLIFLVYKIDMSTTNKYTWAVSLGVTFVEDLSDKLLLDSAVNILYAFISLTDSRIFTKFNSNTGT